MNNCESCGQLTIWTLAPQRFHVFVFIARPIFNWRREYLAGSFMLFWPSCRKLAVYHPKYRPSSFCVQVIVIDCDALANMNFCQVSFVVNVCFDGKLHTLWMASIQIAILCSKCLYKPGESKCTLSIFIALSGLLWLVTAIMLSCCQCHKCQHCSV